MANTCTCISSDIRSEMFYGDENFECGYTHSNVFNLYSSKTSDLPQNVGCVSDVKSKSMQIPGTEAIRTQIKPSNNLEITKITNSQNTKRTYGLLSEELFPKRWPLSNPNRTMYTRKGETSPKL